jgi:hypothetical protein
MTDATTLVDGYVAIWNEADAAHRPAAVAELWTEDAVHIFQPPQEVMDAAAALDVTAIFQARGHGGLEARVARGTSSSSLPGSSRSGCEAVRHGSATS